MDGGPSSAANPMEMLIVRARFPKQILHLISYRFPQWTCAMGSVALFLERSVQINTIKSSTFPKPAFTRDEWRAVYEDLHVTDHG